MLAIVLAPMGVASRQPTSDEFSLVRADRSYVLVSSGKPETRIAVSRDWLIPADEEAREGEAYVSSFDYDESVSSFPLGNGLLGLHLSSYSVQQGGSAQAAAGRDVFLTYDPAGGGLEAAGPRLGITKSRVRVGGCFHAEQSTFLLGDANRDRVLDLGVVREVLRCEEDDSDPDLTRIEGPFYEQEPIRWYVFSDGRWLYDAAYDRLLPRGMVELESPGLVKGPVDFVRELLSARP